MQVQLLFISDVRAVPLAPPKLADLFRKVFVLKSKPAALAASQRPIRRTPHLFTPQRTKLGTCRRQLRRERRSIRAVSLRMKYGKLIGEITVTAAGCKEQKR